MIESTVNTKNDLSFFQLSKRLYRLFRPYFGLRGKKGWRSLAMGTIGALNILNSFTLVFINSAMDAFLAVLGLPTTITYFTYFSALGYFVGVIMFSCLLSFAAAWNASWLAISLSNALNRAFSKNFLETQAYYGIEFMTNKKSELDTAQIMSHDNPELSRDSIELLNNGLTVIGGFIVGLVGLYTLSVPLTFTIMTTTITIPAFMMMSTVLYAIVYNILTDITGRSLKAKLDVVKNNEAVFHHQISHIRTRREQIAFKKGEKFESASLLEILKRNRIVEQTVSNIRSRLLFFNMFHSDFSRFVIYILASPSIIAGKMNLSSMFQISSHFSNVVKLFTFKSENFDPISHCDANLKKLEELQNEFDQWNKFKADNPPCLIFSPSNKECTNKILINNFTVHVPGKDTPILQNFNAVIKIGEANLVEAPSGVGKTTFLRGILGLNPLTSGEIVGLPEKRHFIPSEPYFPYKKTLLEAIVYPRETPATEQEVLEIKNLMEEMGLSSKIDLLQKSADDIDDWYGNILSDGQRKRLMIISAIIHRPDVLFMDEATRGLSKKDQTDAEAALRKYLPSTTIIYTDHNPSEEGFYSNKIFLG